MLTQKKRMFYLISGPTKQLSEKIEVNFFSLPIKLNYKLSYYDES